MRNATHNHQSFASVGGFAIVRKEVLRVLLAQSHAGKRFASQDFSWQPWFSSPHPPCRRQSLDEQRAQRRDRPRPPRPARVIGFGSFGDRPPLTLKEIQWSCPVSVDSLRLESV